MPSDEGSRARALRRLSPYLGRIDVLDSDVAERQPTVAEPTVAAEFRAHRRSGEPPRYRGAACSGNRLAGLSSKCTVGESNGGGAARPRHRGTAPKMASSVAVARRVAGPPASGDGVLVNAVAPRPPQPRSASTTDVAGGGPLGQAHAGPQAAEVVARLASDACTYVHGAAVDVNGGRHLS